MGAFLGIILILLTMIFQGLNYEQQIQENVVVDNSVEIEVNPLYYQLGRIMLRDAVSKDSEIDIFSKTCKENYSNILKCQKRYSIEKDVLFTPSESPTNEFCNAFYSYVKNKKGSIGRLNMNELKKMLVETSTIQYKAGFDTNIRDDKNFVNILEYATRESLYVDSNFRTKTLSTFTEDPVVPDLANKDNQASAAVFIEELREYNLKKYTNYFKIDEEELKDLGAVSDKINLSISTKIRLKNNNSFLNNESVNYYFIGDEGELKEVGLKIFIKENFEKIVNFRDVLLKIKRIDPMVDLMLSKFYDGNLGIREVNNNYFKIYEKYYLSYRNLLNILQINDEFLYIRGNVINVDDLIDAYNNNMVNYHEKLEDLATEIDETHFDFLVLNFETPYSDVNNINLVGINQLVEKEVCDLDEYVKKIKY